MTFSAARTGLTLPDLPDTVESVDVCFDGQRVWSIDLRESGRGATLHWPPALREYLRGEAEIVLRDSAAPNARESLGRATVRFTKEPERTRFVDHAGHPIALNKWGRLERTLSGSRLQGRILDRTVELIAALSRLGLRPFVVGGTLLGGVREGSLLPHDDDADIAYLSEHTSPVDVAIEGFRVGHELEALGYELVRHSATHMQVQFRGEGGERDPRGIEFYIDVFAAFFSDDGRINQPFHVRGEMREDQLVPFGAVTVDGRTLPAPADPEAWLELNYDERWRTPLPGYRLNTPRDTVRRFENWFGSFHDNRPFWNEFYHDCVEIDQDRKWRSGANWILSQGNHLRAPTVIELGAGSGTLSAELRRSRPERRVVGADYSPYALSAARELAEREGFELVHSNLRRLLAVGLPAQLGFEGSFDLVANHLYEQIGPNGREPTLRLVRMALRSGGSAFMTLFAHRGPGDDDDPSTWRATRRELATQAERFGVGTQFFHIESGPTESRRAPYGVRFTLTPEPPPRKEFELKSFVKRALTRGLPGTTRSDVDLLTDRVAELEVEIDELRRDRLRMAELLDLAEQRLTPGAPAGQAEPRVGSASEGDRSDNARPDTGLPEKTRSRKGCSEEGQEMSPAR